MAKKKEELSIEEKLERALVPESEQPYEVPDNWVWTRLGNLYSWGSGGTPSRKIPEYYTGEIPWIKTGDLNNSYIYDASEKITEEAIKKSSAKIFPINTTVMAMYGATIGKVAILGMEAATNQACACAKPSGYMYSRYLFYYLISQKNNFMEKGKGGAQPNISQEVIKNHECPLPPLAEQERIVTRIESLFTKLDEAKELVQSALDSFENRKSAILHKAFTGELTAKWREENGVSIDSWGHVSLQRICTTKITDGTHQTPQYTDKENGVPFISAKDVTSEKINWSNIKYVTKELHEELYKRVAPQIDDILLAKNGTTGVAAIVEDKVIFDIYVTLAILRPNKEKILPQYLYRIVNSPICKIQFNSHLTGIGVPNLHLRNIRDVEIPLPTINEQQKIVQLLNLVLETEKKSKELVDILEQIELIKKSILAKAFRGELGTNDATDESAKVLLREILTDKTMSKIQKG